MVVSAAHIRKSSVCQHVTTGARAGDITLSQLLPVRACVCVLVVCVSCVCVRVWEGGGVLRAVCGVVVTLMWCLWLCVSVCVCVCACVCVWRCCECVPVSICVCVCVCV